MENIRDGLIFYNNLVNINVQDEIRSMSDEVMKHNYKIESNN